MIHEIHRHEAEACEARARDFGAKGSVDALRSAIRYWVNAAVEWELAAEKSPSLVDGAEMLRRADGCYRSAAALLDRVADAMSTRAQLFTETARAARFARAPHLRLVSGGED